MSSDAELIERISKAREGDRGAFDKLVQLYSPRLEAFLMRKLGAELAAKVEIQDLLQESFLQAWRSIGTFRGKDETTFWAWLATTSERALQMEGRKLAAKKRRPEGEVSLQQPVQTSGGGVGELVDLLKKSAASPSKGVRRDERFERLQRALEHLSPEHRKVIVLARVQELQIEEVARRMERSPEAVSMLLYRALLKLKAAFGATESFGLPDRRLEDISAGKDKHGK